MELMVPVPGGRVWADDTGGDAPPLVLLHPGIGDSRIWDPVLPGLGGGYRVIRYDAPGHGRSPRSDGPYSQLDVLAAVLDHFQLPRACLAGCSMGGTTALELALADPARARALVLLCPGLTGYQWPDEPGLDAEYEALVRAEDLAGLAEFGLRAWAAAGADPAARAQLAAAVPAWLTEDAHERPGLPVFGSLEDVRAPSVLMVGDLDRPPMVTACAEAAARIPGCRLVRVPGADHLLPLRAPELTAQAIRERCGGPG